MACSHAEPPGAWCVCGVAEAPPCHAAAQAEKQLLCVRISEAPVQAEDSPEDLFPILMGVVWGWGEEQAPKRQ